MKIKFIDPAYEGFSGMYGSIEFENGVSLHDVSAADVRLYSAIIGIEVIGGDNGELDATYEDCKHLQATSVSLPTLADIQSLEQGASAQSSETCSDQTGSVATYSKQELEKIADEGGITGLREIADKVGVRAQSIGKLIDGILAKQRHVDAGFIESPEEAVTLTILETEVA